MSKVSEYLYNCGREVETKNIKYLNNKNYMIMTDQESMLDKINK